jgi:transcriptional regulator GlxA family with amidase domain
MASHQPHKAMSPTISVVGFLLIPGFSLMSYASAVEPLRAANHIAGRELYRWWHASPEDVPAVASNGAAILPDFQFGADADNPDLMLVCAGGNPALFKDRATFAWLRNLARRGVMLGGLSGGPFVLANAGLLDARRCTIHWEHIPAFEETFPEIELTRSLFEFDDNRITCSGGIAALDMMIAIIGRDHGHELAAAVSEWFLHTHVREGVGPQRMDLRFRLGIADEKLIAALRIMEANLETPISREQLAASAEVSLRQLERSFRSQLGRGVHEHYLALRLGRARQLLRESSLPILDIAIATGFGSASHFSRAFRQVFGFPPSEARNQDHQPGR